MYPELLHLGPVTVYSYGLMLGVAFFVGNILLTREFKRLGRDPSIATGVTMIALVGGIIGAKFFHIAEHWEEFEASPLTALFSPGGLTWYGGVVVSILVLIWYVRRKKIRLLQLAD
ncbi:MAG: prolipoprotein diacylglyceryl transferase, partial [Bacteroidota bacterium]|nr:prolipoprotein diacylglyceryl transferase [Bacteroidota bacterium]